MVYLIKVSKITGLCTQQLCGCSSKEELRAYADRIEKMLRKRFPLWCVQRDYSIYHERDGKHFGFHFTLY